MQNQGNLVIDSLSYGFLVLSNCIDLLVRLDDNNYLVCRKILISFLMTYRSKSFIHENLTISQPFLDNNQTIPNPSLAT